MRFQGRAGVIPLLGEMSAKQTKGCLNSENLPPPFMPPLTRGLSNATHLTGGEIFPFLSLRHGYAVPPADGGGLPLSLRDISLTL